MSKGNVKQLKRNILKENAKGFCSCHPVAWETLELGEKTGVREIKIQVQRIKYQFPLSEYKGNNLTTTGT